MTLWLLLQRLLLLLLLQLLHLLRRYLAKDDLIPDLQQLPADSLSADIHHVRRREWQRLLQQLLRLKLKLRLQRRWLMSGQRRRETKRFQARRRCWGFHSQIAWDRGRIQRSRGGRRRRRRSPSGEGNHPLRVGRVGIDGIGDGQELRRIHINGILWLHDFRLLRLLRSLNHRLRRWTRVDEGRLILLLLHDDRWLLRQLSGPGRRFLGLLRFQDGTVAQ